MKYKNTNMRIFRASAMFAFLNIFTANFVLADTDSAETFNHVYELVPSGSSAATGTDLVITINDADYEVVFNDTIGSSGTVEYYDWSLNTNTGQFSLKSTSDTSSADVVAQSIYVANSTTSSTYDWDGAAFVNFANAGYSTIYGDLEYSFVGNSFSKSTAVYGSAISNYAYSTATSSIGNVIGDFIGNSVYSSSEEASGGAISNYALSNYSVASIDGIIGDFISNSSYSESSAAKGGAIFNKGSSNSGSLKAGDGASIGDITGSFYSNSATSISGSVYGGAVYNSYGVIDSITGDFVGNSVYSSSAGASGGAIYNDASQITKIVGDFIGNSATSESGNQSRGGAIYNGGSATSSINVEGNFIGNYVAGSSDATQGGAIYNSWGNTTITSSEGTNYVYLNNYALYDGEYSDENGGFLYIAEGSVIFDTAENSSITIGDGTSGYDSIASHSSWTSSITKTGAGTLTVNSSMEYFYSTLNVSEGTMNVNNLLGAKVIDIDSGATLSLTISANNTLTNSSLSITNDGTLKLVAGVNTSAGAEYSISTADLDFDSDGGLGAIAYGGAVSGNTFTVGAINEISSASISSTTVSGGSTIKITDAVTSSVVSISTSSESSLTVSSASDLDVTSIDDKEVLSAWSFTITGVDETDGVVLSFLVSDIEDVTLLQLLHRDDESSDWEIITGGSYDADSDLYSVVVYSFSDYALVAVPEPSTYAMIFGALALGLAVYRRRK